MTDIQTIVQRQDPAIEAYRLGLLGDVQGFVRNQIFGQSVQNLRAQGLSPQQIAQQLSRPAQGEPGQPDYRPAVTYSPEDVSNISDQAMFGPPGYQVAQLAPAEQAAMVAAQQGIGGYAPFLSGGAQMIGQGQSLLAGQAAPALQQALRTTGAGQGFINQAAGLAAVQRGRPYEEVGVAALRARESTAEAQRALMEAARFGQQAAQEGIASLSGTGQRFDPSQITPFMSTYEDAAVQQALTDLARQGQLAQQGVRAQAVGAGAFGGSRQAVAEQELQRNVLEQQGRTAAQMRAAGFESAAQRAQQAFEQAQGRQQQLAALTGQLGQTGASAALQAAGQAGQLGLSAEQLAQTGALQGGQLAQQDVNQLLQMGQQQGALGQGIGALAGQFGQLGGQLGQLGVQQAGIGELTSRLGAQDIQNLLTTGATARGVTQATLDAQRLTDLQKYSQPYQQYGFLSDIYSGVPTGQMTTTASSAPQVSPFQTALGLGIQGVSAAAGAQRAGLF